MVGPQSVWPRGQSAQFQADFFLRCRFRPIARRKTPSEPLCWPGARGPRIRATSRPRHCSAEDRGFLKTGAVRGGRILGWSLRKITADGAHDVGQVYVAMGRRELAESTAPQIRKRTLEIGVSGCEWERVLQGMTQPLMAKINEFWNRSLVRRRDFQVVDPWLGGESQGRT